MNYIFLDSREKEDYIGIVEDNRLVEFYIEEKEEDFKLGNIYRGKVDNVVSGINAAFIDIGQKNKAYLNVKDALESEDLDHKEVNIGDILKNNEGVLVQISKEAHGDKGAKLTRHLTIPASLMVLTPSTSKVNLSRKFDSKTRSRLRKFGEKIKKDNIGFLIRTNAKYVDEKDIEKEYNRLLELYRKIDRERNFLPLPKLIYRESKLLYRLVNKGEYINYKLMVNKKEDYDSLRDLDNSLVMNMDSRLILREDFTIFTQEEIFRDLKEAKSRKVELSQGGNIIVDKTEAMYVIDVNSGGFSKGIDLEETSFKTNLMAAKEIARQIRLRNLSGIIIVDFIDLSTGDLKEELLKELEKELYRDSNRANIIGMTKLGLVELTRKKTLDSGLDKLDLNNA